MSRRGLFLLFAILACVGLIPLFLGYAETCDTCLECRAIRQERSVCLIPFTWIEQNAYSKAVCAKEPGHRHRWCYCGSRHIYSVMGMTYSCGHQHPIWQIPVETQAAYAKLVSPTELNTVLHDLDTADDKRASEIVYRIREKTKK